MERWMCAGEYHREWRGDFTGYPFAKFPETYDYKDPGACARGNSLRLPICDTGILVSRNILNGNLLSDVPPGPPVWQV